jgi:hypothetical protein
MGWLWRQAGAHLYRGDNLQQGLRSIHKRSRNEEKPNTSKICEITEMKDLEDTRELTRHEGTDMWAGQPIGEASQPHMLSSCVGFSHNGFLSLSNPKKYIFAL